MQSKAARRIWVLRRLLGEVIKRIEDHAVVVLGFVGAGPQPNDLRGDVVDAGVDVVVGS